MSTIMDKIKIYSVYHKLFPVVENPIIQPILTGDIKKYNTILEYPTDDTGDNISKLNFTFCELTALYWIWKNDKESDIIGLCHYRRYWDLKNDKSWYIDRYDNIVSYHVEMNDIYNLYSNIKEKDVLDNLNKHDMIMADFYHMGTSMNSNYCCLHYLKDWRQMYSSLKRLYPDYYETSLSFFERSKMMPCNMFITRKKQFKQLMEWLFPLLFDIFYKIDFAGRSIYQKRVIGFLAERLINLYVYHNKLNINRLPMLYVEI